MSMSTKKNKDEISNILGYKSMVVLTGSMAPKINPGDIIIDKSIKAKNIKVGDVITYKFDNETLITHRVIEVINKEGSQAYRTKGDANNVDDGKLVTDEQLVGKYSFRIPYAGYVSNFTRTKYGFMLLILLPIMILIYEQFKNVLTELKKEENTKSVSNDNA